MSFFTQPSFALDAFGQRRGGGGWTTQNRYPRELGDVNGDGHADIVGFGADGVYVSFGNADGSFNTPFFAAAGFAHDRGGWETQNQYPRQLGDVNGDGRDDIVGFGDGGVYVSLANADGTFGQSVLALNAFARASGGWTSQDHYPREVADVNGDGRADIVGFGASGVYVALGNVSGTFAQPFLAINAFGQGIGGWTSQDQYTRELGDVNGDGRADIVGFGSAGVYVSLANTDGTFAQPILTLGAFSQNRGDWISQNKNPRELGDVNGDGRVDIVGFGDDGTYVALGNADGTFGKPTFDFPGFGSRGSAGGWTTDDLYPRLVADVTGDGRADIVGFGSVGVWESIAHVPPVMQTV